MTPVPDLAALESAVDESKQALVAWLLGFPPKHWPRLQAEIAQFEAAVVALERARARVFPADAVLPEVVGDG